MELITKKPLSQSAQVWTLIARSVHSLGRSTLDRKWTKVQTSCWWSTLWSMLVRSQTHHKHYRLRQEEIDSNTVWES